MHIVFATRGPKNHVDHAITLLQGQSVLWNVEKDGTAGIKKGSYNLGVRVCPVQLWDVSFPKEYKDPMLATLFTNKGEAINSKYQKYLWGLRLALGLDKIPDYDESKAFYAKTAFQQHIESIAIGMKEDRMEDGTEMI